MARKIMHAADFVQLVKSADEQSKDCVWISEQMESKGFSTKPNSIYQRINKLNLALEEAGKTARLPVLKQDNNVSAGGNGGKKLDLDSIEAMFG